MPERLPLSCTAKFRPALRVVDVRVSPVPTLVHVLDVDGEEWVPPGPLGQRGDAERDVQAKRRDGHDQEDPQGVHFVQQAPESVRGVPA